MVQQSHITLVKVHESNIDIKFIKTNQLHSKRISDAVSHNKNKFTRNPSYWGSGFGGLVVLSSLDLRSWDLGPW